MPRAAAPLQCSAGAAECVDERSVALFGLVNIYLAAT